MQSGFYALHIKVWGFKQPGHKGQGGSHLWGRRRPEHTQILSFEDFSFAVHRTAVTFGAGEGPNTHKYHLLKRFRLLFTGLLQGSKVWGGGPTLNHAHSDVYVCLTLAYDGNIISWRLTPSHFLCPCLLILNK